AIANFDRALEIRPRDFWAWFKRGDALRHLKRYEEALLNYDRALTIQPDDEYAWYNKACCYAILGNADLAIENLQKAICLHPSEYKTLAKTDPDFQQIRGNQQFQALLQGGVN
ncbi:MAG TPA: tetratricopeptide repeat protein, partial [Kamptonema sp.]|nr:tetratricopeptide repeat protein [Kamptonema sp.]